MSAQPSGGMTAARIFGKGIAFPPRIDRSGRLAWSEGETNVEESLRVLLTTDPGERVNLPDYGAGLSRYLFQPNVASTHVQIRKSIQDAIARWEPRVQVDTVLVDADPHAPEAARAVIQFRLVATRAIQRISLTVPTSGQVPS